MNGKPYHYIDKDIRYLVACMNAHAFRTYASCQGHGYPVDIVMPYVAFTSSVAQASRLSQHLREDAESGVPELNWGWDITGSFDSVYSLCYRLSPIKPHKRISRWRRESLRQDFMLIAKLVKLSAEEVERINQVQSP
ncbi:hypothetical protein ACMYSO_25175 (plasmid) [Klebsiella sp. B345]|uniref:hypothetical protein n=1 Tax=Klebsiella sp. B345 TaxID=2755398 RepID=UPI003DA8145A